MTVNITKNTVEATASGVAGETVTVDFLFFKNADLVVYVKDQTTGAITNLTLDTDYSVTGAGVSTGGTVTMITTQTAGDKIIVDRWLDVLQPTGFPETGAFPAKSHETALDRGIMIQQQVLSRMGGVAHSPGFTEFMSRLASNTDQWDAKTSIIADVKDPGANQDAATKGYVDGAISSGGNLPAPADPADDGKILVAGGGAVTYQNFRVPTPAAADDERVLEATGVGEGGFKFADLGRRNFLINGGFTVNQRGSIYTSATFVPNSDDNYLLDRWNFISEVLTDAVDISQSTSSPPTGAYAAILFDQETTGGQSGIVQILEARDCAPLLDPGGTLGRTVSLSFDVKGSSGVANVRAAVLAWDGTADAPTSDVVSTWNASGTNPTLATNWTAENTAANLTVTTSWVRKKIEGISIDTSGAKNVAVFIWVDDDDLTAGTDSFRIANVQLELSSTAHAFVPRHVSEELALCQRYYSQSYDEGVFASSSSDTREGMSVFESAATAGSIHDQFPARMRIAPTVAVYDWTDGTVNRARDIADSGDATLAVQSTANGTGQRSVHIRYSSATDNTSYGYQWTADAEL